MRKFKRYDKVKVIDMIEISSNIIQYIGKYGVITKFNYSKYPIEVNFSDGAYIRFKPEELRLVQSAESIKSFGEDLNKTTTRKITYYDDGGALEKARIEEKAKQSPCKTYIKKLEDFRKTLTPDEIIEDGKFQNDMNDMRKNQTLQEVADEVNELFNDSDNQQIKKSDVMAIITDKIKLDD